MITHRLKQGLSRIDLSRELDLIGIPMSVIKYIELKNKIQF